MSVLALRQVELMSRPDGMRDAPHAESRSLNSPMLGKASREVKFRIDEDTGDLLQKKADGLGLTLSEYLRERTYIDVYGIDHVQSVARRRLEMVAGIGPTTGTES